MRECLDIRARDFGANDFGVIYLAFGIGIITTPIYYLVWAVLVGPVIAFYVLRFVYLTLRRFVFFCAC